MTQKEEPSKANLPGEHLLFWVTFIVLIAIGIVLRTYDISTRPLHSDEGVNYHFLKFIENSGYYSYSHENYHGPLYFYLTYFFTHTFGYSDLSLRGSSILMGIGIPALLLLLLKIESRLFVLLGVAILTLSSSMVFMSRYAIHETLFAFAGLLLAISVLIWHKKRNPTLHLLSGSALGLLIATKETFIITLFCVFFAFVSLGQFKSVLHDLWKQKAYIVMGLFVCFIIMLVSFTGGLQWPGGLREMLLAVPQWIGRNESDTGHFKPFFYYFQILFGDGLFEFLKTHIYSGLKIYHKSYVAAEPQFYFALLFPGLAFIFFPKQAKQALLSSDASSFRFFTVWSLLALLVYSFVSYKTPWLIINITIPLSLLLAFLLERFICSFDLIRTVAAVCTVAILAVTARASYLYNFKIPYGDANPYSYVHTHQGMLHMLKDIDRYKETHKSANILIATGHYWPLPYYFRDHQSSIGYQKLDDPSGQVDNYDIMILDSRSSWNSEKWLRKYYRLSDVQESFTFYKR